jgi:DEAD/DEAH box helicase domain-containing protein
MGASVMAGYPGTIASTWQQAGRAGRGEEPSLAILVTSASPLDQFIAHHPDYFFGRSPENALINPDNLLILLNHLRCALFELPFRELESFGTLPFDRFMVLEYLIQEGIAVTLKQIFLVNTSIRLRKFYTALATKVILQAELRRPLDN